jgi:hypothetical protein
LLAGATVQGAESWPFRVKDDNRLQTLGALWGFALHETPRRRVDGLDFGVSYDWMRAHSAQASTTEQELAWSVTSYAQTAWGKPFVTVEVDHAWRNGAVTGRHNSWGLGTETGIEFQAARALAVTPFVGWDREASFSRNDLRYGIRTTYRLSREWGVTATPQYLDVKHMSDRTELSLGMNYHF